MHYVLWGAFAQARNSQPFKDADVPTSRIVYKLGIYSMAFLVDILIPSSNVPCNFSAWSSSKAPRSSTRVLRDHIILIFIKLQSTVIEDAQDSDSSCIAMQLRGKAAKKLNVPSAFGACLVLQNTAEHLMFHTTCQMMGWIQVEMLKNFVRLDFGK